MVAVEKLLLLVSRRSIWTRRRSDCYLWLEMHFGVAAKD